MNKVWNKGLSFLFTIFFFLSGVYEAPDLLDPDLLALCTNIDYNYIDYNDYNDYNIIIIIKFEATWSFCKIFDAKVTKNEAKMSSLRPLGHHGRMPALLVSLPIV